MPFLHDNNKVIRSERSICNRLRPLDGPNPYCQHQGMLVNCFHNGGHQVYKDDPLEAVGDDQTGQITGVAYINNCPPNWTRKRRSRYLVVREEMMMPKPSPTPAMMSTNNGEIAIQVQFGWMSVPCKAKYKTNNRNSANCIESVINFEIKIKIGTAMCGK